jgi:DNA processing protein
MNAIDIASQEYPERLKEAKNPPKLLYYRGEWNIDLFDQTISVVGSRKMTRYGAGMTETLVTDLARHGISIISGFMYGIDAKAHETAVNASKPTIAVMPCGIENIHPEYQSELYHKIIQTGGLIISEYEGNRPPALWTYPQRNRIIVALSPNLLVVEAGSKSGAMISARIAKQYNRTIFAVPGSLYSNVSIGPALLIKAGANIVLESNDILEHYSISMKKHSISPSSASLDINPVQKKIMKNLQREPLGSDDLSRLLKKPVSKIGAQLTLMHMNNLIELDNGLYFLTQKSLDGVKQC